MSGSPAAGTAAPAAEILLFCVVLDFIFFFFYLRIERIHKFVEAGIETVIFACYVSLCPPTEIERRIE